MDKSYLCRDCGATDPKRFERRRHTHCSRCRISAYRHTNTPAPVDPPPLATGDPSATQAAINSLSEELGHLFSLAGRRPPDKAEQARIRAVRQELGRLQDLLRRQLAAPRQAEHEARLAAKVWDCREDLTV